MRLDPVQSRIRFLLRLLLFHTPMKRFMYHRYTYNFEPAQLAYLLGLLDQTREVDGSIYEVGCSKGHTTVFLNRHLQYTGCSKEYVCLDTFSGFVPEQVKYEQVNRGKNAHELLGFRENSATWFRYTMKANNCDRVRCVIGDAEKYVYDTPISFCLLDVDLYKPTIGALRNMWPNLSPGAIVVVDDCEPNHRYDGAFQAYTEFMESINGTPEIVLNKLGILRKRSTSPRNSLHSRSGSFVSTPL